MIAGIVFLFYVTLKGFVLSFNFVLGGNNNVRSHSIVLSFLVGLVDQPSQWTRN